MQRKVFVVDLFEGFAIARQQAAGILAEQNHPIALGAVQPIDQVAGGKGLVYDHPLGHSKGQVEFFGELVGDEQGQAVEGVVVVDVVDQLVEVFQQRF